MRKGLLYSGLGWHWCLSGCGKRVRFIGLHPQRIKMSGLKAYKCRVCGREYDKKELSRVQVMP